MGGPKHSFVALVLVACALGAICRALQAAPTAAVELRFKEVVRVHGGQPVLVLEETNGSRRLPVPISRAEALLIERVLKGGAGLEPRVVDALGGRVLRVSIDEITRGHGFRAHLAVGSGAREFRIEGSAGEALSLALQAGAPIVADPAVLDDAAVSESDLRGRAARNLSTEPTPAPVLHI